MGGMKLIDRIPSSQCLTFSLFLRILTVLRSTGQVFCRMFFNSGLFSHHWTSVMGLEEEDQKQHAISSHIKRTYYRDFPGGPGQLTEQGDICGYTNECIHIFINISYVIVCICIKLNMSSHRCLQLYSIAT